MDLNRVIQGLSSSGVMSGLAGGLAGSALLGAVSGKKGRKMAEGALKIGALAAVGGLAYSAYQRYQQNAPSSRAAGEPSGRLLPAEGTEWRNKWRNISEQRFEAVIDGSEATGSLLLLRAMIAAAAADGHLDNDEQDRVFEETRKLPLSQQEKAQLFDELQSPLSLQQIVAEVRNPETAVEVYAASLVAVDESRAEAQTYLRALALALDLPEGLVESVHEQVNAARQESVAA